MVRKVAYDSPHKDMDASGNLTTHLFEDRKVMRFARSLSRKNDFARLSVDDHLRLDGVLLFLARIILPLFFRTFYRRFGGVNDDHVDWVVALMQAFFARQPEVRTSLQDILHPGEDAPHGRLTQAPSLRHVEPCRVLAPRLRREQDLVFNSQLRRAAWLCLCALEFSTDNFAHLLESLWLDTTISLEVCGQQGFDVFVAHQ